MSQHDLSIANQGFPAFRSDLNDALQALGTNNSGATAPSTTYANQLWYDTANNILKIRNEDNDAWISLITLDQTSDAIASMAIPAVSGSVNFDSNTLVVDATNDRVGVGTASPATKLDVVGQYIRVQQAGSMAGYAIKDSTANKSAFFQYTQGTSLFIGAEGSTPIIFANTDALTERMRIDSSGRLLFGTTTYGGGLTLAKSDTNFRNGTNAFPFPSGNSYLMVDASSTNSQNNWIGITGEYGVTTGSANLLLQANFNNTSQQAGNYIGSEATSASSAVLTFGRMIGGSSVGTAASKSESMRIDSSGSLLIGQIVDTFPGAGNTVVGGGITGTGRIAFSADGVTSGYFNRNTSDGQLIRFARQGNEVGGVNVTTTSTSYATSSDYRLKNITGALTGYKERIMALQPKEGTWKADGSIFRGFVAHDFAEQYPSAVTGEKDAINEDGSIKPQGMQAGGSETIADLVAIIQELVIEVDNLKSQLNS